MGIVSTILSLIAVGIGFYIFAAIVIFIISMLVFWNVYKTQKKMRNFDIRQTHDELMDLLKR